MGLFQKRTSFSSAAPLYSIGMHKSMLIVGLGNPGKEYDGTRHNIGFEAVDAYAKSQELSDFVDKKDLKALLSSGNVGQIRVILAKPNTFMNLSGEAVQAIQHFYKIRPEDTLVVHDELDIDFGKIRTSVGGSAAGHNGIKSLIEHTGEQFGRVRVGIGPKKPTKIDSADFVLQKFTEREQSHLKTLLKETSSIINDFIASGELYVETRSVIL